MEMQRRFGLLCDQGLVHGSRLGLGLLGNRAPRRPL